MMFLYDAVRHHDHSPVSRGLASVKQPEDDGVHQLFTEHNFRCAQRRKSVLKSRGLDKCVGMCEFKD